jgi:hypothetical protein
VLIGWGGASGGGWWVMTSLGGVCVDMCVSVCVVRWNG